jgi:pyruvate dehydrogenase E1 component beta subunit
VSASQSPRILTITMSAARLLFHPQTSRLLSSKSIASVRPAFQPAFVPLARKQQRRGYAEASGVKEMAVRDALNEALAEELEQNDKVFILGEEVAQYNGA